MTFSVYVHIKGNRRNMLVLPKLPPIRENFEVCTTYLAADLCSSSVVTTGILASSQINALCLIVSWWVCGLPLLPFFFRIVFPLFVL